MATTDRYTCEDVLRRLDDYVDRELSAAEMQRVREHLESCALCVSECAFEVSLLEELRPKLRRIAAPPELIDRVSRALTAAIGNGKPEAGRA